MPPFYLGDGADICHIEPGDTYVASGFGEAVNPAFEEDAITHSIVCTISASSPAIPLSSPT